MIKSVELNKFGVNMTLSSKERWPHKAGKNFKSCPGKKGDTKILFNNLKKSIQIKNDSIGKNMNLIKEFCEMIMYIVFVF